MIIIDDQIWDNECERPSINVVYCVSSSKAKSPTSTDHHFTVSAVTLIMCVCSNAMKQTWCMIIDDFPILEIDLTFYLNYFDVNFS